jgi:DNA-3-methyladenine glycosylase II
LVRAIAHQQVHGRAAEAILGRFIALCPEPGFPTPESVLALTPEAMRGAGLSANKVLAIRDIAEKAALGIIPNRAAARRQSSSSLIPAHSTTGGYLPNSRAASGWRRPGKLAIHGPTIGVPV